MASHSLVTGKTRIKTSWQSLMLFDYMHCTKLLILVITFWIASWPHDQSEIFILDQGRKYSLTALCPHSSVLWQCRCDYSIIWNDTPLLSNPVNRPTRAHDDIVVTNKGDVIMRSWSLLIEDCNSCGNTEGRQEGWVLTSPPKVVLASVCVCVC